MRKNRLLKPVQVTARIEREPATPAQLRKYRAAWARLIAEAKQESVNDK
jgi:hypothetical protein